MLYGSKYLGRHHLIIIDRVRGQKTVEKEAQIGCICICEGIRECTCWLRVEREGWV